MQDWSASSSHGPSISGMSVVKLRLSERLKLGAMSGCDPSIPVSMIPTRTPELPRWRLYDLFGVALIMRMSHWRSAKGSASGAGAPLLLTAPSPAAFCR